MGDVDDHPEVFHPGDDLAAKRGQPALFLAVHRSGQLVVEEVSQPGHPEPGGIEPVQILSLAFQIMQPLNREHRADRPARLGPRGQQPVKPFGVRHLEQLALGLRDRAVKLGSVIERAFGQRIPGRARLHLGDQQGRQRVGGGRIAVVVLALGGLGD